MHNYQLNYTEENKIIQTPEDSKGQGSLASCSLWGRRVGHDLVTEEQKL